jgi:hypothetical protein
VSNTPDPRENATQTPHSTTIDTVASLTGGTCSGERGGDSPTCECVHDPQYPQTQSLHPKWKSWNRSPPKSHENLRIDIHCELSQYKVRCTYSAGVRGGGFCHHPLWHHQYTTPQCRIGSPNSTVKMRCPRENERPAPKHTLDISTAPNLSTTLLWSVQVTSPSGAIASVHGLLVFSLFVFFPLHL